MPIYKMSRRYPEVIALLAISCACAPQVSPAPGLEQTAVEASLPGVGVPAAIEKVKAAFVAEGLTIAEASSAGTVVSVPYNPRPSAMISTAMTFRAAVLAADSGSRVILTATYRDNRPITSSTSRFLGEEGWQRLERLGAALRKSP